MSVWIERVIEANRWRPTAENAACRFGSCCSGSFSHRGFCCSCLHLKKCCASRHAGFGSSAQQTSSFCSEQRKAPAPVRRECEVPPTSSSSPPADAGASSSSENDDVDEAVDESGDVSGDDNGMEKNAKVPSTHKAAPKTWSNAQFPEGVKPLAANWDLANLAAAQAWTCPCIDRRNCLGAERGITILHLYEHRKTFLTTCNNTGGKRDAMRAQLESHYSSSGKSFTRSFVVGPLADCCSASAALANGVSFQTFANARADLRGNRPSKGSRKKNKGEKVSYERSVIDTYIRR